MITTQLRTESNFVICDFESKKSINLSETAGINKKVCMMISTLHVRYFLWSLALINIANSCFVHHDLRFCHTSLDHDLNDIKEYKQSFSKVNYQIRRSRSFLSRYKGWGDITNNVGTCIRSEKIGYSIQSLHHNMPIILTHADDCGRSLGNHLGNIFDLIGYILEHGMAYATFHHLKYSLESCHGHPASELLFHLPDLILPVNITHSKSHNCSLLYLNPWEHTESYLYRYWHLAQSLNHHMVILYIQNISTSFQNKHIDITNTSYLRHHSTLGKHGLQNPLKYQTLLLLPEATATLSIHFRCSDNLDFHAYGLLPLHFYTQILHQIFQYPSSKISSIVIIAEPYPAGDRGELCRLACKQLKNHTLSIIEKISRPLVVPVVKILHLNVATAYTILHMSKFVICSLSTFCLMATAGSSDTQAIYFPVGRNGKSIVQFSKQFLDKYNHTYIPVLTDYYGWNKSKNISITGFISQLQ